MDEVMRVRITSTATTQAAIGQRAATCSATTTVDRSASHRRDKEAKRGQGTPALPPAYPAAEMLKCVVRLMVEAKGEAWVDKANVWQVIKQLDPTFDTRERAG
jgi:hypothetical protein